MPQSEQLARTPARFAKRNRAITPDRGMGESQSERELHFGKKEKDQSGSMKRKKSVAQ